MIYYDDFKHFQFNFLQSLSANFIRLNRKILQPLFDNVLDLAIRSVKLEEKKIRHMQTLESRMFQRFFRSDAGGFRKGENFKRFRKTCWMKLQFFLIIYASFRESMDSSEKRFFSNQTHRHVSCYLAWVTKSVLGNSSFKKIMFMHLSSETNRVSIFQKCSSNERNDKIKYCVHTNSISSWTWCPI